MRTPERLEAITTGEHARIRDAFARFEATLGELHAEQERVRAPVFTKNLFGDAVVAAPIVVEKRRFYELDALRLQWGVFSRAFAVRMDRVRDELLPTVRAWHRGDDRAHARAIEQVAALQRERAELEHGLAGIRTQVVFVEPLKAPLQALTQAIAQADLAEDGEVFPAVLAGSRESMVPEGRQRTSDDVARALRTAQPERIVEEPERPGCLGRLTNPFGR